MIFHQMSTIHSLIFYSICLAVSKGWKKVLESLHDLWMKLDTTTTRKAIGMPSLKAYLRRSNYNLNHAIISSKAGFDAPKLLFLTKTCKSLKILDMRGSGPLSNSLATALPLAQQLQKLTTSANLEMTASGVNYALKTCPTTLIHASFLNVCGGTIMTEFGNLRGLQRLEIGGSKYIFLDLVSLQSRIHLMSQEMTLTWNSLRYRAPHPILSTFAFIDWNLARPMLLLIYSHGKGWST